MSLKTVYIIRHAKSDWDNVNLTDYERPLSKRWIKEIEFVSKILKNLDLKTDFILCSSSIRTRETLEWLWEELDVNNEKIVYERWIYEHHWDKKLDYYIELISKVDDKTKTIVLVWHNPFISKLAWFLILNENFGMWTLWFSIIDFDIEKWEEVKNKKGRLDIFINTWEFFK